MPKKTPPTAEGKKPKEIEIQTYTAPEPKSRTEEEAVKEFTDTYRQKPIPYRYSFPVPVNGKMKQIEVTVYYWEISETHYIELTVVNGVVLSTMTLEKLRSRP